MDTLHNTERLVEALFGKIDATCGEIEYHGICGCGGGKEVAKAEKRWHTLDMLCNMAEKLCKIIELHEEWQEEECEGQAHGAHGTRSYGRTAKTTPPHTGATT